MELALETMNRAAAGRALEVVVLLHPRTWMGLVMVIVIILLQAGADANIEGVARRRT
jgi:hypothetical protein